MTDDPAPLLAEPPSHAGGTPPPPPPAWPEEPPARRVSKWWWVALVAVIVVFGAALAGFWVRLPYYTVAPGGELPINKRIEVDGARVYPPDGEVLLLFVRERARVNVWRYLQARLDPDIDVFREEEFTGGRSPQDLREQARADMLNSQLAAKKVALEQIGYDVPLEGALVFSTLPGTPAARSLEKDDVIVSVNGEPIRELEDLGDVVSALEPGDQVTLVVRRDGELRTVPIRTTRAEDGRTIIGVTVTPRYDFPIDIEIDTSDIGGPSAGLAMTLAIIDDLTPGELTGATEVAVTGTIDTEGNVGEIGGIEQKAVAAKRAGATLFIVPECRSGDAARRAACEQELDRARERSGDTPVVPVEDVDEALRALEGAGGDPATQVANAA